MEFTTRHVIPVYSYTGREPPASRTVCDRFLDVVKSLDFWVSQMLSTLPSFMLLWRPCIWPACACFHGTTETIGWFLSFSASYGSSFFPRCASPPVYDVVARKLWGTIYFIWSTTFFCRGDACARDVLIRTWANPWQGDDPLLTCWG